MTSRRKFGCWHRLPQRRSGHEGDGRHTATVVLPVQIGPTEDLWPGYVLLVFVYDKRDDPKTNTAVLNILHALFIEERRTADFTITRLIRQHLETGCNAEDLIGLMHDKNLPVDDIEANKIAAEAPFEAVRTGFSNDFQRPSVAASVLAGDRRGGGSGWILAVEVGWHQGGGAVARLTMTRKKERAEYGDFQTPPELARAVCSLLAEQGLQPAGIPEPTCGVGNFLFAGLDRFTRVRGAFAADIKAEHVERARVSLQGRSDANKVNLVEANFFATDWKRVVGQLPEPILVLGNPPWVTNAGLGVLGSQNLPVKSNFQKHRGLDAITGKANFDISESDAHPLAGGHGRARALAMLCKAATARKVLGHAWENGIALGQSAVYGIDTDRHFAAAVDAVLLVVRFQRNAGSRNADVYGHLGERSVSSVIGFEDGILLADVAAYHRWKHLSGDGSLKWRSGIKHDCAKVMELCLESGRYRNGLGELAEIEDLYVYPMLKKRPSRGATQEREVDSCS